MPLSRDMTAYRPPGPRRFRVGRVAEVEESELDSVLRRLCRRKRFAAWHRVGLFGPAAI